MLFYLKHIDLELHTFRSKMYLFFVLRNFIFRYFFLLDGALRLQRKRSSHQIFGTISAIRRKVFAAVQALRTRATAAVTQWVGVGVGVVLCQVFKLRLEETDRQIDRWMDRQIDRQLDRQIDRWIDRQIDRQIRQIDRQMDRQKDTQTDSQIVVDTPLYLIVQIASNNITAQLPLLFCSPCSLGTDVAQDRGRVEDDVCVKRWVRLARVHIGLPHVTYSESHQHIFVALSSPHCLRYPYLFHPQIMLFISFFLTSFHLNLSHLV